MAAMRAKERIGPGMGAVGHTSEAAGLPMAQRLAGGGVVDLGMARGRVAIARDQIENCQPVRRFARFRLIVGALRGGEGAPIGVARVRVAVAIQEFGVSLLSGEIVGFLRRGARQGGALRRRIATLVGLEGTTTLPS